MGSDFYSLTPAQQGERLTALARTTLPHWRLEGATLEIIKMRENAVFRATMPGGERYALRIHRHAYHTDVELHSELLWMRALADSGINVPTLIPSATGELFIKAGHADVPEVRQVDLFAWVDGRQLGSAENGVAGDTVEIGRMFHTIGELTGRMHNQSSAWRVPPGFQRHAWDTAGLVGENPFWGRFWELAALAPDQRRLIRRGRERVARDLDALGRRPETYSLIHADFTPENLLVNGEQVRPIDFDDAGFGWHLFDIATSLFFHFDADYFPAAREALIRGYRSVRPLPDRDLDQLPLFFAARGFTYLGWVHTRHETQTAQELTPMIVDLSCRVTGQYLSGRGWARRRARPVMSPPVKRADIVERYMGAWNDQDAKAVRRCFTPDGCYIDSVHEKEIVGDEIIAYCEESFERYPDMHYEIINRTGSLGGTTAVQWIMRGRDIEPIFNLPATGDSVSFVGVDFLVTSRGRIKTCTSYYDVSSLQRGTDRARLSAEQGQALEKYERTRLSVTAVREIRRNLERMIIAERGFTDPELSLATLAQRLGISPTYLSQVINREFKMSFRDFVNRRRVAAAQSMLRDPAGSGNSVMQIGFAVGFNSASAFYAAFQRFARTTPLLYRKNVKVKTP